MKFRHVRCATFCAIMAAVFLALGWHSQAHASEIVYTDTIPIAITNWTGSVVVDQFDPSLGELQSVIITTTGHLTGSVLYESRDAAPATVTLNLQAGIELQRPDTSAISLVEPLVSVSTDATAFDGGRDFAGTSGGGFGGLSNSVQDIQTLTAASDLTLFSGTGTVALPVQANGQSQGTGAGNLSTEFDTLAGADVVVKYNYLAPDIAIAKTPDLQTVISGSPVTFTIRVTNTGELVLINVGVTDPLARSCDRTIGALAIGEAIEYQCLLPSVAAGFINVATVNGQTTGGIGVDDSDDAVVQVINPAIEISKTPDLQTVLAGSTVTFTIIVTNTGDVELSDVAVSDPIAPNCDNTIGTLAVGANTSYTCTIDNVTAGFTNVATVTGLVPTGEIIDDTDDAVLEVINPAIEISKSPDLQTVVSGSDVTFTIVVTNTGDVDLVDVEVSDPLVLSCGNTIGALAIGASTTYTCTAISVTTAFTNVATVTGRTPTGIGVDDSDDARVEIIEFAIIGDYVWFDTNVDGIQDPTEQPVENVLVTLYDLSDTPVQTTTTNSAGNYKFVIIEPGVYTVHFELPNGDYFFSPAQLGNDSGTDSDVQPNGRTPAITVTAGTTDMTWDAGIYTPPDMIISKSDGDVRIVPGATVAYSLVYKNEGLSQASGVMIEEIVPAYTTFVPELSTPGWSCDNNETVAGTRCRFAIGNVQPGASNTTDLIFAVRTDLQLPQNVAVITNIATIQSDGTRGERTTARDATDETPIDRPTSLDVGEEPLSAANFTHIFFVPVR